MKVLLVVLFSIIISFASGACLLRWREGEVAEAWEGRNNDSFKVRVLKYPERGDPFIPGAYYVFQSASVSSEKWVDIMTFRHDDPIGIPQNQVRFVNDKIGYVFMGWNYAVTTNGGASWSIWDAYQNLPEWKCCHYRLIEDVRIEPDGGGTITLSSALQRYGVTKLYTRDYGRHWSLE